MNEPTPAPCSRTAVARIALDTLIGGLVTGLPVYMGSGNLKMAVLTGLLAAGKTLQSRMAPDLATMNRQRQAEKSMDSAPAPIDPPAPAASA